MDTGWQMMDTFIMVIAGSCFSNLLKIVGGCHAIAANGSRLGEVVDFGKQMFN